MPPPELLLSDLVRDSKIETEVLASCIQHIFFESGPSVRERHVRREERWVRQSFLGQGAYGTVYLEKCEHGREGKLRAVKEIKKFVVQGQELDYVRELEAIVKFSHPKYSHCFVRSDGWFELGDSVFIAMEYLELGDLQKHLTSPLPEPEARQITSQVLEGLEYMHSNGFVHRDLKPGNIMVVTKGPDWFVKIADFGISKRRQQDVTTLRTLQRGTFGYAAPEALGFSVNNSISSYSFSVDMWSLGAVAYRMLTNTTLFQNMTDMFRYVHAMSPFPLEPFKDHGVSESSQDFILKLMSADPKDRLSASSALEHEWMNVSFDRAGSSSNVTGEKIFEALAENTWISFASQAWSSNDTATTFNSNTIKEILGPIYQRPSVEHCLDETDVRGCDCLPADSKFVLEAVIDDGSLTHPLPSIFASAPQEPENESFTAVFRPQDQQSKVDESPSAREALGENLDNNFSNSKQAGASSQDETPRGHGSNSDYSPDREFLDEEELSSEFSSDGAENLSHPSLRHGNEDGLMQTGEDWTESSSENHSDVMSPAVETKDETQKLYYPLNSADEEYLSEASGASLMSASEATMRPRSRNGHNGSWRRNFKPLNEPSGLETKAEEKMTNCQTCTWKYSYLTGPIEYLSCGHFMCHVCLLRRLALSLVLPQYMPPRCCDSPNGEIDLGSFRRMLLDPKVYDAWRKLKDIRWRKWVCPRGHGPLSGSLLLTTGPGVIWKQPVNCSGCLTQTYRPIRKDLQLPEFGPGCKRTEFCLFCSHQTDSENCRCGVAQFVNKFIADLDKSGVFDTWSNSLIAKAAQTKTEMLSGAKIKYQTLAQMDQEARKRASHGKEPDSANYPEDDETYRPNSQAAGHYDRDIHIPDGPLNGRSDLPPVVFCYRCRNRLTSQAETTNAVFCDVCTAFQCRLCGTEWKDCKCPIFPPSIQPEKQQGYFNTPPYDSYRASEWDKLAEADRYRAPAVWNGEDEGRGRGRLSGMCQKDVDSWLQSGYGRSKRWLTDAELTAREFQMTPGLESLLAWGRDTPPPTDRIRGVNGRPYVVEKTQSGAWPNTPNFF